MPKTFAETDQGLVAGPTRNQDWHFEKHAGKDFLNPTPRDRKEKAPNIGRFFGAGRQGAGAGEVTQTGA
jgi:hypothetical protein